MVAGEYVEHRLTKTRGTVLETRCGWATIYSPNLGSSNELWFAPEGELTTLLKEEDNTRLQDACGIRPV